MPTNTLTEVRNQDGTLLAYMHGREVIQFCISRGITGFCVPSVRTSFNADTDNDEQLEPVAYFIHWEGPAEQCEHCYAEIESAYGDPDAEQESAQ